MLALALLAACTQQPARVEYKGSEYYGREHEGALDSPDHETYAPDSDRFKEGYTRPVEAASVPAVGVADLPPPGKSAPAAASAATTSPFHTDIQPQTYGSTTSTQVAANDAKAPFGKPSAPLASTAPADNEGKFIWPVTGGKVISHFGLKSDGKSNDGVNIAVAEGEPIWAAADGTVVYAGDALKDYGNMVILRHDGGWMSAYAHERSITVKKNDRVKQGGVIGYVGTSGGVGKPQLHFVLRHGTTPVDPEKYLPPAASAQ